MMNSLLCVLALVLGAAGNACAPVVVTETVYVTATCLAGQCPPPPSSTIPPAAPPPVSSAADFTAAPPPSAPPANGVTFTSAHAPKHTGGSSLLCTNGDTGPHALAANVDKLPMPHGSDRIADVASYNPFPTLAASLCQAPDDFHKVTAIPGQGSIKNSCKYEVYVDSVGCGKGGDRQLIPAGDTWSEPFRSCPGAGIVYKVTKAEDPSKPLQFELTLGVDNLVHYDISFLDCMRPNTTDLSACPGWEGGVQCIPGRQGCQVFVCGAGEYCDGSAYTVPEFGQTPANKDERIPFGAPVSSCDTMEEGMVFELCATG